MDSQLQSISKIFTDKLFRIPDYQRGYAWSNKQLKDYWGDILQLDNDKNHYVGVLTLEKVPKEKYEHWEDDEWIIKSKSFEPFYIVDGQQRMTTTIILIQAITELYDDDEKINYSSTSEIKKRFIFDSKDDGISRSYIFGYEKDNPSYDFLKRSIFLESGVYSQEDTIYTHNLENAKKFFIERLRLLNKSEIEFIYKKVTQNLLFNIYTISSDIDVFITFETMNNRGKPLTNLELLKNRLIYLSTKFNEELSEKNKLRKDINNAWRSIYHYLGKNRLKPLSDDVFLLNHFIVYFGSEVSSISENDDFSWYNYRRSQTIFKDRYESFLLDEKFNVKNIDGISKIVEEKEDQDSSDTLSIHTIHDYVNSLQKSVEIWYNIFNPIHCIGFDDNEKHWFEKLSRIGTKAFWPLILVAYQKKIKSETRIELLKAIESYTFVHLLYSYRHMPDFMDYSSLAIKIHNGNKTVSEITKVINDKFNEICKPDSFIDILTDKFKTENFYNWLGIRYFLFEYEQDLKNKTKTSRDKINWDEFSSRSMDDYITVEHIYPQTAKAACWTKNFNSFTPSQRKRLNHSLGNLLPLSRAKNSSLQNKCFADKIGNDNSIGFKYGSYSEIEICKKSNWVPKDILDRGIKLLDFMEKRWGITLGDRNDKIRILGLEFMSAPKISK